MIVATNDDALNFLLQYRDGLFGRVPTVFCGVNNFHPEQLQGADLITGVNEFGDFRGDLNSRSGCTLARDTSPSSVTPRLAASKSASNSRRRRASTRAASTSST